ASALDKLQPLILSYNNKGWSWKKHGVVSSQIIESKIDISKGSNDLWEYAKDLIQKSIEGGFLVEG
ncbi:MAG: phosphohydrolase, partial [Candidatus Hodarchaeota archaeon]